MILELLYKLQHSIFKAYSIYCNFNTKIDNTDTLLVCGVNLPKIVGLFSLVLPTEDQEGVAEWRENTRLVKGCPEK